jgi:hypothetical protein
MMKKKLRLRTCHPHGLGISEQTKKSVADVLALNDDRFTIDAKLVPTSELTIGRNYALSGDGKWIKDYKLSGFDKLVTIDADMKFTIEQFMRLYELSEKYPIVSAAYQIRDDEEYMNAGYWGDAIGDNPFSKTLKWNSKGIKKVDWIGAGLTIANIDALNKMDKPWYYNPIIYIGEEVYISGEDIGFCINAQKNKVDIYVDCDCKVKHLTNGGHMSNTEAKQQQQYNIDVELAVAMKSIKNGAENFIQIIQTILAEYKKIAEENKILKQKLEEKNKTKKK